MGEGDWRWCGWVGGCVYVCLMKDGNKSPLNE